MRAKISTYRCEIDIAHDSESQYETDVKQKADVAPQDVARIPIWSISNIDMFCRRWWSLDGQQAVFIWLPAQPSGRSFDPRLHFYSVVMRTLTTASTHWAIVRRLMWPTSALIQPNQKSKRRSHRKTKSSIDLVERSIKLYYTTLLLQSGKMPSSHIVQTDLCQVVEGETLIVPRIRMRTRKSLAAREIHNRLFHLFFLELLAELIEPNLSKRQASLVMKSCDRGSLPPVWVTNDSERGRWGIKSCSSV